MVSRFADLSRRTRSRGIVRTGIAAPAFSRSGFDLRLCDLRERTTLEPLRNPSLANFAQIEHRLRPINLRSIWPDVSRSSNIFFKAMTSSSLQSSAARPMIAP